MTTDTPPDPDQEPGEIVVFSVRREAKCAECGAEIFRGAFITLDKERRALCMDCADLAHLEFLPRGDAALTRRATKYSSLRAVVVEWSRARKRYERQGILADREAIEKAETECLEDAERRERQKSRRAIAAAEVDKKHVEEFTRRILAQFPKCPRAEADGIAAHACRRSSGRVGRSAGAKEFDPQAIHLAVAAAVRHRFTNYDELLLKGWDRHEARAKVRSAVEDKLANWRGD